MRRDIVRDARPLEVAVEETTEPTEEEKAGIVMQILQRFGGLPKSFDDRDGTRRLIKGPFYLGRRGRRAQGERGDGTYHPLAATKAPSLKTGKRRRGRGRR